LFDHSQPTICYNLLKHEEHSNLTRVRLDEENFLEALVADLQKRKIQSIIIEGGSFTLQKFIDARLWDEARIFASPRIFSKGIKAPVLSGFPSVIQKLDHDTLRTVYNQ
jgi:diaminohydroxyphosphoribosylaminopyrimidine deaminase/5-amino-6-(5-phosphoribosylamino)uracil reductase